MARPKKAAAASTPQEQFASLVEAYRNLPADDPNAFKGKDPNAPATNYQKSVLDKMGVGYTDKSTALDAHASMKAFAVLSPEKNSEIWAQQKAEAAERKAAEKAAGVSDGKSAADYTKQYTVNKADVDKPATYHQIVQLNAAGIRKYSDPSQSRQGRSCG